MRVVVVVLVLMLSIVISGCDVVGASRATNLPPVRQSEEQAKVYAAAAKIAKEASEEATPVLLSYLDSQEFRSGIAQIEIFQNATAEELLAVLQTLVKSSDVGHNFPPISNGVMDVDLTRMMEIGFLPNYWTSVVEKWLPWKFDYAFLQGEGETKLMGFPEFDIPFYPVTLNEALIRPVYACINIQNIPGNCIGFGQTSLVFHPSYIRNITIISAVDTGLYVALCIVPEPKRTTLLKERAKQMSQSLGISEDTILAHSKMGDCSAWNRKPATFEDFNHIFLASAGYWNYSLAEVFVRRFSDQNVTINDKFEIFSYYEGDIAGGVVYPDAVFYVQAAFIDFFGTNESVALQQWCIENKWPLVWVDGSGSVSIMGMILDPIVSANSTGITNIQPSEQDTSFFNEAFQYASLYGVFTDKSFEDLYNNVTSLNVAFIPPDSICLSNPSCFAVLSDSNTCVCRV